MTSPRSAGGPATRSIGLLRTPVVGIALVVCAYLSVFYSVTAVVGGADRLVSLLVVTVLAATVIGRFVPVKLGVVLGGTLFAGGMATYVLAVPNGWESFSLHQISYDTIRLLSGYSVMRLLQADVWVLSLAPVPTFLAWYLAARGRDIAAVTVAGAMLAFFVLTGDAGYLTVIVGVVGATLAVGLRTLSVPGGVRAHWDTMAVIIVCMILLTSTVNVVPGGEARPIAGGGSAAGQSDIVGANEEMRIQGALELSPQVKFTVRSDAEAYWRTDGYDRYTGDGWVQTGDAQAYDGSLSEPPGETTTVEQTITAEAPMESLPAAWQPVELDGDGAAEATISPEGGITPGSTLGTGERYTVRSSQPVDDSETLSEAGTDYPSDVEARYLQLPDSTPDRVGDFTTELTADDENPYETAVTIERYLESEKAYSLDIERPDGDIADAFLFEMEAGYCTYYATTMVAMLRSQGIPARYVSGYTPGERVAEDRWVVRGQNAHAWVEVYFPEHGWVAFDPTPGAAYDEARQDRLEQAREDGEAGIDTEETGGDEWGIENETDAIVDPDGESGANNTTENTTPDDPDGIDPNSSNGTSVGDGSIDGRSVDPADYGGSVGSGDDGGESDENVRLPVELTREAIGIGALALFGVAVSARRFGYTARVAGAGRLLFHGRRSDPEADVERAFERLERVLAAEFRPRRPGETPRRYLRAAAARRNDPRIALVGRHYERARYGGGVDREAADEAITAVTHLVWERVPGIRALLRRRTE
ncbi:transglutaminase TgpA family protein [Haloferacaceae archaeon DSL9]